MKLGFGVVPDFVLDIDLEDVLDVVLEVVLEVVLKVELQDVLQDFPKLSLLILILKWEGGSGDKAFSC